MNLSERIESSLTPESLALIRLVKTEAERLNLPLYIVGGSVRDLLLGSVIKDFDLIVEGDAARLADALLRKFGGKVLFHARFGTATWTLDETTSKRLNIPIFQLAEFPPFIDLISARSETYPEPGALPAIKRSTIDDDLRRRDFTVNAMAVRLDGKYYGDLYDPLGGQKDLENKLIRILHPQSFIDDPTRMFRAVRYAVRYQFELESVTQQAAVDAEARAVLSRLSGERIRHEFDLIFEEEKPLVILVALEDLSLIKVIHPALEKVRAMALSHLKKPADEFGKFALPGILSLRQALGWILYLLHLPQADIDTVARRLAFPALLTDSIRAASSLLADLPSFKDWKPSQWTFHLDELPSLSVYAVWLVTSESPLHDYLTKWQHVKPITTGDDLVARGLEPGPKFKDILARLRAARLDGEVGSDIEEEQLLRRLVRQ
ncbi:MAG: CCA tRNA nucleotidyltransferase [Chloroflexi bacterium]|nr:CCA tRNA nucleotidyltransferase [Chloroflexota bacterium]